MTPTPTCTCNGKCPCHTGIALDPIQRLTRDLLASAKLVTVPQIRYLVDSYYSIQEYRKASAGQIRALSVSSEPHEITVWLAKNMETLENQIKRFLDAWTDTQPVCQWAKSITGIGPVISAGLAAHIDITKAPTVGHIWRFAGLDPTQKWEKKTKRPWNAGLKVLCWKIGKSFVKVSGLESDVYGKIYVDRKIQEAEKNERLEFKDQAAEILKTKKIDKKTDAFAAYSTGKLPPAHIHARAKRYAVKLFLAHYHHVAFRLQFGIDPPKPYVIEHLGHVHFVQPPNFPATA